MLSAAWHRYIFLFGLIGLAAGMLFGTVPTSIPQIILAANWLLEGGFSNKWGQLKSNKLFWILISLFLLHVLGMIYTENVSKGFDDLRNKIPLLTLPLILFSTKPLDTKELKLLFHFFFFSVLVSSICCYLVYAGFTKKVIVDIRKASIFMSHIRFSLFIAFAIIGLIYSIIKEKSRSYQFMGGVTIIWLLFFLYKLEMATGFLCLITTGAILLLILSIKKLPKKISAGFVIFLFVLFVFILSMAISSLSMFEKNENSAANVLFEKTKNGRQNYHDTIFNVAENGNLIFINICHEEIRKEWQARSSFDIDKLDKKGNTVYYTLIRYLASKGLTKDSVGISLLNDLDVKNIENGNTNYKYDINSGLVSKWRELVWEYASFKLKKNPSGHTLTMRLEFWETAIYIIKQHIVFGVGTGDAQDTFDKAYVDTKSQLDMNWRLRSHNQYLAIGVSFGFVGLFVFIFYLIFPAIILKNKLHFLYWPFYIIALLSFITEDTLETQSGVTFFIFFQALFLWLASYKTDENKKEL